MIRVREVIVVEGRYDKNALSQIMDAMIVETSGFGVFHDADKRNMIRSLALKNGIIILTDSDGAGLLIRNHLKSFIPSECIKNAYIPEISGKERRKNSPSKEGLLGVEGMSPQVLEDCLRRAGATIVDEEHAFHTESFTKTDLFFMGLSGGPESGRKRKMLQSRLGIPTNLSSNSLLEYLNRTVSRSELKKILDELE